MAKNEVEELRLMMDRLLKLGRAPSQFSIISHLLVTGRALTIREMAGEIHLTPKATERAVAKLLNKMLIQRSPFRDGAYSCDSRRILLGILLVVSDLSKRLENKESTS